MTAVPASVASSLPSARPGAAGAAPAPTGQAPALDPVKLLLKYRWVLVGAALAGMVLGVGAHFLLMKFYPIWRTETVFECFVAPTDIGRPSASGQVDDVALDRFMQSQAKLMTQTVVLQAVAEDTRLPTEAPKWSRQFLQGGQFNTAEAFLELQDEVSARVIPQTAYITMGMSYQDKKDVTAIVRLIREKYLTVVSQQINQVNTEQLKSLGTSLDAMSDQIKDLQGRRERLMADTQMDVLNRQSSEAADKLRLVNQELVKIDLDLKAYKTQKDQLEADLQNPGGVRYSDSLRDAVEQEPLIMQIKQTINALESERRSLLQQYTREHRRVKEIEKALTGYKQNLEVERERMLAQKFDGQLDQLRKVVAQLEAQSVELSDQKKVAGLRMTELTKIQSQVDDLDSQIRKLIETRNATEDERRNLQALQSISTSRRVQVAVPEREPEEVLFPKLKMMLPLGMLLSVVGVLSVLVLREMIDQRVKSPADVALIPRARVLGYVPDAEEDPAGVTNPATAFRDKDRSVMAECFRNIRNTLMKRTQAAGHRTVLVVGGMPGSGASTVIANLASALAAADRRVLVIDANMRRPMLHKTFGVSDTPGLSDALADGRNLESVVQRTGDENVDVLSAGSRGKRNFERLSTDKMSVVLAEARESYDLVLIDAPPMVVSGDGLSLASRCDASILVVRALQEKRGLVARLRNDLGESKAELLGVLVNGVKSAAGGYLKGNLRATHEYHSGDTADAA